MLTEEIPGPQHHFKDDHGLINFVTGMAGKETIVEECCYETEVEPDIKTNNTDSP